MIGIDPLYIVLGLAFAAVGFIVYIRAKREQEIKRAIVTPKAQPKPEPLPILDTPPPARTIDPDLVKDKAMRLLELKRLRESDQISQVDYDTARMKILFER